MGIGDITLLVLDVDGVLTDGRVTLDRDGEPHKTFHVHDGHMIKVWQDAGGRTAILTGRQSPAVRRRAEELGVTLVRQGAGDKLTAYDELLIALDAADESVCYVGDDWPDIAPMRRAAFPVAVANAVAAVKRLSGYVTIRRGGEGAVAEVIELLMRKQGRWKPAFGS